MKTLSKTQILMLHEKLIEVTGGSNGIAGIQPGYQTTDLP